MIEYIKGDITKTDCPLIAHGCNAQGVMGSGVARALYEKWPEIRENYLQYCYSAFNREGQPNDLLGKIQIVNISDTNRIINCFTQQNFGNDGQIYLNYNALQECLWQLNEIMHHCNYESIAFPKIGCGLAGGNWDIVSKMIEDTFSEFTVKVYSW